MNFKKEGYDVGDGDWEDIEHLQVMIGGDGTCLKTIGQVFYILVLSSQSPSHTSSLSERP